MLPDYETCYKHVRAFKQGIKSKNPQVVTYPEFWEYKTTLERANQNLLDEGHIEKTAAMLRALLINLKIPRSGIAAAGHIRQLLENLRPEYNTIIPITLGSGQVNAIRKPLEVIYEKLGAVINNPESPGRSSIAGKSIILMAIWGQVPRFDSLNRRRFERWTHSPAPLKLPHLKPDEIRYEPIQFGDIVETLDHWVAAWPQNNEGKSFISSFFELCPGIPPGRQIDIIYHWKMPDPRVDYRLQSQGS